MPSTRICVVRAPYWLAERAALGTAAVRCQTEGPERRGERGWKRGAGEEEGRRGTGGEGKGEQGEGGETTLVAGGRAGGGSQAGREDRP